MIALGVIEIAMEVGRKRDSPNVGDRFFDITISLYCDSHKAADRLG